MKKYVKILVLIVAIFLLTGCYSTDSFKGRIIAKKAAKKIIEEKYGFKSKVESIDYSTIIGGYSVITLPHYAVLNLSSDKGPFEMLIDPTDTSDYLDSFQKQEIIDDINQKIQTELGITPYHIDMELWLSPLHEEERQQGLFYIKEYYDKTNLDDILDDNAIQVFVEMVDQDFSKINADKMNDFHGNFYFINYKTQGCNSITDYYDSYLSYYYDIVQGSCNLNKIHWEYKTKTLK